jgi:GTPase SAR1 family protein
MPVARRDPRDLARVAEQTAADAGLEVIAARLLEHRAERDRPGTRVAVVGDFNRGKSTLVNRLVGADVLPTGNLPLTRTFVKVVAVTDSPSVLVVRWPSGAAERRALTGDDPWRGLVFDQQTPAVSFGEGQVGPEEPRLLVSVPSAWLSAAEVELIDTPGLHEGRVDHVLQTQRAVALSDIVVLTISAPSPLSLIERQFLAEELLNKRIPHVIVVLTKLDQLPAAETGDFIAWFTDQVAEISPAIAVQIGPGLAPGGAGELARLQELIVDLAHADDVIRLRDRRLAWQVADACAALRAAALAAQDQLQLDETARRENVAAAKLQLDEDDLRWNELKIGLEERRLRFSKTIQESATAATSELFETLTAELHRVSDVKAWWEQELPVRLRRELKTLTRTLESQISLTISRDLGWLDSEVTRTFALSRKPTVTTPVSPADVGDLPQLELHDIRRRRTATRIVTAVGGIVGAALAFASGVAMPAAFTIGGSAIAGIIAERDAEAKTEEQRTLVRQHVRRLLDDILNKFRDNLAAEVGRSYQVAFEELRQTQAAWRTARLEAIAAADTTGPDATAWEGILRRVDDIVGQLPVSADDERAPAPGINVPDVTPDMTDEGD